MRITDIAKLVIACLFGAAGWTMFVLGLAGSGWGMFFGGIALLGIGLTIASVK